jgi:Uma2 family endonuclease
MASTKALVTAQQLYEMGSDARFELVRGELVPMSPVGGDHGDIVFLLGSWLVPFVRQHKLGRCGTERGFILAHDPDLVRAPDAYFVSRERERPAKGRGFYDGAPDLAVEVLSPSDKAIDVQAKVHEYLTAGTRLVWVIDPQSEAVTAYHPSGDARLYSGDQDVSGEDVLPGFSFRCRDLFLFD